MKPIPPVSLETARYCSGRLWASKACLILVLTALYFMSLLDVLLPILVPVLEALITVSSPSAVASDDDAEAYRKAAASEDARAKYAQSKCHGKSELAIGTPAAAGTNNIPAAPTFRDLSIESQASSPSSADCSSTCNPASVSSRTSYDGDSNRSVCMSCNDDDDDDTARLPAQQPQKIVPAATISATVEVTEPTLLPASAVCAATMAPAAPQAAPPHVATDFNLPSLGSFNGAIYATPAVIFSPAPGPPAAMPVILPSMGSFDGAIYAAVKVTPATQATQAVAAGYADAFPNASVQRSCAAALPLPAATTPGSVGPPAFTLDDAKEKPFVEAVFAGARGAELLYCRRSECAARVVRGAAIHARPATLDCGFGQAVYEACYFEAAANCIKVAEKDVHGSVPPHLYSFDPYDDMQSSLDPALVPVQLLREVRGAAWLAAACRLRPDLLPHTQQLLCWTARAGPTWSRDGDMHVTLVSPWNDGGSLDKLLGSPCERGRLHPAELVQLLLPVARVLEHMGRCALVHGDIKPHNVFLRAVPADAADVGQQPQQQQGGWPAAGAAPRNGAPAPRFTAVLGDLESILCLDAPETGFSGAGARVTRAVPPPTEYVMCTAGYAALEQRLTAVRVHGAISDDPDYPDQAAWDSLTEQEQQQVIGPYFTRDNMVGHATSRTDVYAFGKMLKDCADASCFGGGGAEAQAALALLRRMLDQLVKECCQPLPQRRLSMGEVVSQLEAAAELFYGE